MKSLENFKKEMIIDKRDIISKTRSFTEFTLNTIGWILWFFLIRPLVLLTIWYIAYRFFKYHMFTLEGIQNPGFFGIGAGTVLLIFLTMFGWNRYNLWRFRGLDRRKTRDNASAAEIAKHHKITEEQAEKLRNAQTLNIFFEKDDYIRIELQDGTKFEALYSPLGLSSRKEN